MGCGDPVERRRMAASYIKRTYWIPRHGMSLFFLWADAGCGANLAMITRVDIGSSKNLVLVIITNEEHRTSATACSTELFVAQWISGLTPVSGATGAVWSRWKRVSPMSDGVGGGPDFFLSTLFTARTRSSGPAPSLTGHGPPLDQTAAVQNSRRYC